MRISLEHLRTFIDKLPTEPRALRELFDDVGLEVKRQLETDRGLVLVLELLANRGDHHCYAGIARELGGRTGGTLTLPSVYPLEVGASPVPLRAETELCLAYSLTPLTLPAGALAQLPASVLTPLLANEAQSISPVVDATNIANLELGQPTHAFDADRIEGGVTIRLSQRGERALPLFAEESVELPEGTIVIADDAKVLAIAGVIGCQGSEVTDASRRILLESAAFDPVAVRKAAKRLHLQTDASTRFERGSDPAAAVPGAGRVVQLLVEHAGAKVTGTTGHVGTWSDPQRDITIDTRRMSAYFEKDISPDETVRRLERYGFARGAREGDRLTFRVPSHRIWDVHNPEDLYEEIAKSFGYNTFPTVQPPAMIGASLSFSETIKHRTENVLTNLGFYEVITSGFYDRAARDKLGMTQDHPLWNHVVVQNAIDRGNEFLKNNCLVHALDLVAANSNLGVEQIKAFEWTRAFIPDASASNGCCNEQRQLWLVAAGPQDDPSWAGKPRPSDFYFMKGIVEELAVHLDLALRLGEATGDVGVGSALHPYRRASVLLGDRVVGLLGEVHPNVLRNWKIKRARPVYLELAVDALEGRKTRPELALPPVHPPLQRDVTFALPQGVTAQSVIDLLHARAPAWLERVAVVDLFAHADGGTKVANVTFRLAFTNDNRRSADEVNDVLGGLVTAVTEVFGPRGVKHT